MNKDEWIEVFEELENELERKPTDKEVIEKINGRADQSEDRLKQVRKGE